MFGKTGLGERVHLDYLSKVIPLKKGSQILHNLTTIMRQMLWPCMIRCGGNDINLEPTFLE